MIPSFLELKRMINKAENQSVQGERNLAVANAFGMKLTKGRDDALSISLIKCQAPLLNPEVFLLDSVHTRM